MFPVYTSSVSSENENSGGQPVTEVWGLGWIVKPVLSDQGMNSNLAFPTFILSLLKNSTKYKNAFLSDQCRDIEENTRV